jgi:hypothetical protein
MPVIDVIAKWSERSADIGRRMRGYTVKTDSVTDTEDVVHKAAGLPKYGAAYDGDATYMVTARTVKPLGPTLWEAVVTWDRKVFNLQNPEEGPLSQPPEYRWSSAVSTEEVEKDAEGFALINTADEPITGVMEDFYDSVLTVTFNVASYDERLARQYRGAVNADEYRGAPPGTVLVSDITAVSRGQGSEQPYFSVGVELIFREDGWDRRFLNQGFREWVGLDTDADGNKIKRFAEITDKEKRKVTEPVHLNATGQRLVDGADPVWLLHRMKKRKNLSALGI